MSSPKFRNLSISKKSLVFIEFSCFFFTIFISEYLTNYLQISNVSSNISIAHAVFFSLIGQLSCLSLGLYNSKLRVKFRGIIRRLALAIAITFFMLSIVTTFLNENLFITETLAIAAIISLILIIFIRFFMQKINLFGLSKRNVLVLGAGERASIIEKRMRRGVDRQDFFLHGFVTMNDDVSNGVINEHIITLQESLVSYALDNGIDEIVVANDERRKNLPVDELFACKIRGIDISEILDFIERETGQIAVNLIYPSWVIYSNGFVSINYLRNALDWLFNASMGFCLLLLTWPIMLITACLIKLEEGIKAPIFYFQERVGIDGIAFKICKFRSMRVDAEKNGAQMSSENDDRITKVGNFIRKYRIDELPQIYNVISGDMGFVGPRPERPEFVQQLIKSIPYYNERHNVKPGLTGWAQLKYPYGSTEEDSLEKLKYDLYYIKHRSFMLDLLILIRTVEIVLFGKGR